MAWFKNYYECDCGCTWHDEWSCMVDDDCSDCGTSNSPVDYEVLRDDKAYEVTLEGFDARTSDTDHLIKWVMADNRNDVAKAFPNAMTIIRLDFIPNEKDIDMFIS